MQDGYRTIMHFDHRASGTFGFEFIYRQSGGWVIKLIEHPDTRGRSAAMHDIHWLPMDGEAGRKICFEGRIHTLEQALTVAARWAEGLTLYRSNQITTWPAELDLSYVRWNETAVARAAIDATRR